MEPVVYVIGGDGLAAVKIGTSVNPHDRIKALQTGAPARLAILWTTPGGHTLEGQLHARFLAYRTHGEWFDLTSLGDPVTVVEDAVRAIQTGAREALVRPRRGTGQTAKDPGDKSCCWDWECDGRFGEICRNTGRDMSHQGVREGWETRTVRAREALGAPVRGGDW
ncbi:GIY-YIG nuclease family protein [Streptomyces goshikiensis]|uniref:GIY-YIG nuclease family protein n=1 Tax=Streptomyces goshikiensis TaxID=1942 RepID=UPI0033C788C8